MDWSKTLKWLADNPSAGPGGDPDLFGMPLLQAIIPSTAYPKLCCNGLI